MKQEKEIINAEGQIMGRLASMAAKKALLGKKIEIVNCSEAVITGDKYGIIEKYLKLRKTGGSSQRGPYFPSSPEKILKRVIRGMLPYKKQKGREALKRIRCYNNVPEGYEAKKPEKFESGMKLKELWKRLKE